MQTVISFFDESERIGTEIYAVGGVLGTNHATAVLELRWRDLLARYGIRYFKASELNAGEGEFRRFRDHPEAEGWVPFSQRERLLFQQIKTDFTNALVGSRGLVAIGAVIVMADYERLVASGEPGAAALSKPHFVASSLCLVEAGDRIASENGRLPEEDRGWVYPIFDSHEVYEWPIKRDFPAFCAKNPNAARYLMEPAFESDREWVGLQAADNVVFEFAKYLENRIAHPGVPPRLPLARMADAGMIGRCYLLDYAGLRLIARAQQPAPIEAPAAELLSGSSFRASAVGA